MGTSGSTKEVVNGAQHEHAFQGDAGLQRRSLATRGTGRSLTPATNLSSLEGRKTGRYSSTPASSDEFLEGESTRCTEGDSGQPGEADGGGGRDHRPLKNPKDALPAISELSLDAKPSPVRKVLIAKSAGGTRESGHPDWSVIAVTSPGQARPGARMGSQVRAQQLRLSTRTFRLGCNRTNLQSLQPDPEIGPGRGHLVTSSIASIMESC